MREDIPVADARARFLARSQDYKVELIDDLVRAAEARGSGVTGVMRELWLGKLRAASWSACARCSLATRSRLQTVSLYTNGPFTDLCRGPHAPSTKTVGAFKLQSVAGAYWRGDRRARC